MSEHRGEVSGTWRSPPRIWDSPSRKVLSDGVMVGSSDSSGISEFSLIECASGGKSSMDELRFRLGLLVRIERGISVLRVSGDSSGGGSLLCAAVVCKGLNKGSYFRMLMRVPNTVPSLRSFMSTLTSNLSGERCARSTCNAELVGRICEKLEPASGVFEGKSGCSGREQFRGSVQGGTERSGQEVSIWTEILIKLPEVYCNLSWLPEAEGVGSISLDSFPFVGGGLRWLI